MTPILNAIALRRKFKVNVASSSDRTASPQLVASAVSNIKQLGFILHPDLIEELLKTDDFYVTNFHDWLTSELKKMVGANKRHVPMYPNFPSQVAEASDAELFFNAIMHYFGDVIGERTLPVYEVESRPVFLEKFGTCDLDKLEVIGYMNDLEVYYILDEILSSKATPNQQDKDDIKTFLGMGVVPTKGLAEVPCKETLAFAYSIAPNLFGKFVKTATDVLRIAVAWSDGDVTLAKKTRFKKFKRIQRKQILMLLEPIPCAMSAEDMMRYRSEWKRLGEILHPGEFGKRYPNANEAFRLIRNEGAPTFNSKVEREIKAGPSYDLLQLLKTRPGDFARRLDKILRMSPQPLPVVQAFMGVVKDVSSPVLHQLYSHFWTKGKLAGFEKKICFPKGDVAKALEFPNFVQETDADDDIAYGCRNELMRRYAELPSLGKVWCDPVVRGLLIPQSNRSTSSSLYSVGRGSRLSVGNEKNTVRLFMWWKDQKGKDSWNNRVDLDLSAMTMDENFKNLGHCSWTQLRGEGMYHSGDITSAPNGASEFLDIDLDSLNPEVRYIACSVTCFSGQPLATLDEAFCGVMLRDKPNSGEIYEPASVATRADLRTDSTQCLPFLFDVKTREIIWADLTINNRGWGYAVENSRDKQALACDAVARMHTLKPGMADLFTWHVIARNSQFVETREEADFVIAADGDLNPFDTSKVMAEWV